MILFSKTPYLTEHIKINYETGCIERFSGEKKQQKNKKTKKQNRERLHWKGIVSMKISDIPFFKRPPIIPNPAFLLEKYDPPPLRFCKNSETPPPPHPPLRFPTMTHKIKNCK